MLHQAYFKYATPERFSRVCDTKLSIFLGAALPNSTKLVLLCYHNYLAKPKNSPPEKPQNWKLNFECVRETLPQCNKWKCNNNSGQKQPAIFPLILDQYWWNLIHLNTGWFNSSGELLHSALHQNSMHCESAVSSPSPRDSRGCRNHSRPQERLQQQQEHTGSFLHIFVTVFVKFCKNFIYLQKIQ